MDDKAQNGARYEVRDGILKRLAKRAANPNAPRPIDFERLWHSFSQEIEDGLLTELAGLSSQTRFRLSLAEEGRAVWGENLESAAKTRFYHCSPQNARLVWEKSRESLAVSAGEVRRILGTRNMSRFTAVIVNALKHRERAPIATNGGKTPNFVLIIDEINRGNISKIFGELITLLEPDKRLGGENPLRVALPYSQENFALPSNLFLIGTMNTADKSLALLDVALRRRFVFEEVAPDFTLCPGLSPTMRAVLEALNRRLMLLLDREHRLGHAFFMEVGSDRAAFNAVFKRSIVPLLQEFFYSDWKGLRDVLGESGEGKIVREMPEIPALSGRTAFAWWHDLDAPEPDFSKVLAANYKIALPRKPHQAGLPPSSNRVG